MSEYIEIKGKITYEKIPKEITTAANYCICPQPDRLKWNVSSLLKIFEYMDSSKPILFTPKPAYKSILPLQHFVTQSKEDQIENYVDAIKRAFDNRGFLYADTRIAPVIIKKIYDWLSQLQIILIQYHRALYIC